MYYGGLLILSDVVVTYSLIRSDMPVYLQLIKDDVLPFSVVLRTLMPSIVPGP